MGSAVLNFKDLFKSYNFGLPNQIDVLKGINFSLEAGETVGLVSPSGAGKTTMLNMAGLLDKPSSGIIEVMDTKVFESTSNHLEVFKFSDKVITRFRRDFIGFIYQFHHLLPEFTALENVELPKLLKCETKIEARSESRKLLESVGLSDRMFNKPGQLSGGEQQRVAICRALANSPKILLADEPTGNLDSETSKDVFQILINLVKKTKMSAVIATHNSEIASKLDRVIQIKAGKLL